MTPQEARLREIVFHLLGFIEGASEPDKRTDPGEWTYAELTDMSSGKWEHDDMLKSIEREERGA